MVASPSAYDPVQHPVASKKRRDLVLLRMFEQGYITRALYESGKAEALPTRDDLTFPKEDTEYPYFTSWVKQQVVDRLGGGQQGAQLAFEGGLQVKTTIDSRLQEAAEKAIDGLAAATATARAPRWWRSPTTTAWCARCTAATTTRVAPFNLATQGQRQPGSSFKPFVLAEALKQGDQPELDLGVQEAHLHPQGR